MPAPKWPAVARNEYRLQTSGMRKIRPYFPLLAVGLLAVYLAYIAPAVVSLFIDDFIALLLSQAAVAMVEVILFLVFVYFTIIPITDTLRETQAGQLEIFLAAPIKPSDVLLGEFVGQIPFYAIYVTVVTGFFTTALKPLGLDLIQIAVIVMIFIVTFLSAYWIGNVIASLLRAKFAETARGRDIGKALALFIAIPIVAVVYAIQFGGLLEAIADPDTSGVLKTILGLLPSSWGAEVIVRFAANPGGISAFGVETLTRLGGLFSFFVAALWLGTKAADRAYSLEPTTFTASIARTDGRFYQTIKHIGGGGSFGALLVSIFKDYTRRFENLSKIFYIAGLILLMNIFIVGPKLAPDSPKGPVSGLGVFTPLLMIQFMFPILGVFVAGEVTLRGRENLFIYRKTPLGVERFIKARLLQGWLMVLPVSMVVTAISTLRGQQISFTLLLAATVLSGVIAAADLTFVLGLFLLNPAFSEKSTKFAINMLLVIFVSIGLFLGPLLGLMRVFPGLAGVSPLHVLLLQNALSWMVGGVFLYLGKRNLSRIE